MYTIKIIKVLSESQVRDIIQTVMKKYDIVKYVNGNFGLLIEWDYVSTEVIKGNIDLQDVIPVLYEHVTIQDNDLDLKLIYTIHEVLRCQGKS